VGVPTSFRAPAGESERLGALRCVEARCAAVGELLERVQGLQAAAEQVGRRLAAQQWLPCLLFDCRLYRPGVDQHAGLGVDLCCGPDA
jgi:hypothetical protein